MSLLAIVRWDVSPELFTAGPFHIRWYGALFATAFFTGYLLMRSIYRKEGKPEQDLGDLMVYAIVGALVGARLAHCIFYSPRFYAAHPLEVFEIWKGGLASHGGAMGMIVATWLYSKRHPSQPCLWLLDRIGIAAALGGVFIRIGNLFNSEILGRPTTLAWAFVFLRVDDVPRHPVQLYEAAGYLLIFLVLLAVYRSRSTRPPGFLLGLFFVLLFGFRFGIEFLKEPQEDYSSPLSIVTGQWLSVPFIAIGIWLMWKAGRRPRPAA